jgi:hypothetical protein
MKTLIGWSGWGGIALLVITGLLLAGVKACEGHGVEGSIVGIVLSLLAVNTGFFGFGSVMFWLGAQAATWKSEDETEDSD